MIRVKSRRKNGMNGNYGFWGLEASLIAAPESVGKYG